jgi:hypothetical protein
MIKKSTTTYSYHYKILHSKYIKYNTFVLKNYEYCFWYKTTNAIGIQNKPFIPQVNLTFLVMARNGYHFSMLPTSMCP